MNNGKELLELAAKAAGIDGEYVADFGCGDYYYSGNTYGILYNRPDGGYSVWNPLTDNGDAFRLAVKLRMEIRIYKDYVSAESDDYLTVENIVDDPYAATRRAIVRAAACIGE